VAIAPREESGLHRSREAFDCPEMAFGGEAATEHTSAQLIRLAGVVTGTLIEIAGSVKGFGLWIPPPRPGNGRLEKGWPYGPGGDLGVSGECGPKQASSGSGKLLCSSTSTEDVQLRPLCGERPYGHSGRAQ